MRVRLSEIAEARANPGAYKARKDRGEEGGGGWYPHRLLECGIHQMHKRALSPDDARRGLREALDEAFPNNRKVKKVMEDFEVYVDEFASLGHQWVTGWRNVSVPLPSGVAGDFFVGGRVMRIDLAPDGYAAWLFSLKSADWDSDPRLPLLQAAVAADLGADVEEVTAGVYSFEDGMHHAVPYDHNQIDRALDDLRDLLIRLR